MAVELTAAHACLTGYVGIDEAEPLLSWAIDHPEGTVDLSGVNHLHAAVCQVLMACSVRIVAWPRDEDLARWLPPSRVWQHEANAKHTASKQCTDL
ncbi:MAG: hypothetical protein OWU84_08155 [Firmicutes bacterium]|nr:hypothetical protein [Bacillota bacterium]